MLSSPHSLTSSTRARPPPPPVGRAPNATSDLSNSSLTIGGLAVQTHSISNGVFTFKNGGTNLALASMSDVPPWCST